MARTKIFWVFIRMYLGLLFIWTFFDKMFGLGFATKPEKSWLVGISPTTGFLERATRGPFAIFFHSLAGSSFVDWLFMLGVLLIGLALIIGVGIKIAGLSGAILSLSMYLALLPPANHPFLDEHILYIICFLGLALVAEEPGSCPGLGKFWKNSFIVQKCKWLE